MTQPIRFHINDKPVQAEAGDADMALIDFLHERQDLTGTKFCCGIGVCRACTVATREKGDGVLEKTLSCSTPVSAVENMSIYTVESLGSEQALAPLQQAFLENFSFQCGYCAPGFLMAATAMLSHLKRAPVPASQLDAVMETWVGGNLCRCTGYVRYMEAIRKVALPYTLGGGVAL
ncbi:2Fe-2S iron-sulfur cluster-binding protein [Oxalobacteraceae bacterium OTU3CAMAD1]|nr:2Fe-2S iron-sulfur cluster-binding protein [Oxalobacteraceae bacterium OTU3CAMAD1]